jgi:putative tricarboxylic transport membrane protein
MTELTRRFAIADVLVGLGVAALGAFIAVETSKFQVSPLYAKVGPQLIPYIIAGGLILFGLLFAASAARPRAPAATPSGEAAEEAGGTDWLALGVISIGLVAQMLLLEWAGFAIAAAVLFYCVAFGFGSRRYLRDGIIAVLLAMIVYVGFTRGLDLPLPPGLLKGLL